MAVTVSRAVPKLHQHKSRVVSRLPCQVRIACKAEVSEAAVRCVQCATIQCLACERIVHSNTVKSAHLRPRLVVSELPCQAPRAGRDCQKATVYCETCSLCYCSHCDHSCHSNGSGHHLRLQLAPATATANKIKSRSRKSQEEELESAMSCADDGDSLLSDRSCSHLETVPMETVNRQTTATDCSRSFHLVNDTEVLQVRDARDFLHKLGCKETAQVKVVSIFGNTGEGKSHTLNHAFFGGEEVFRTSSTQAAGTVGVWAAFDPALEIVVVDTEGLLGVSAKPNQRTRLLLKVLAISDVIIYRTRAERLHSDLFQFLGDASKAYKNYFRKDLKAASERLGIGGPLSQLGPSVIIFHETQHTQILKPEKPKECIGLLRQRFHDLGYSCDAFSNLDYVGVQTLVADTNFSNLVKAVKKHLNNATVRSSRQPVVVYKALQVLNDKFNGNIEKTIQETFPDQYFSCSGKCLSCGARCHNTMNHQQDNLPHDANSKCRYQHQFDNRLFTCKACFEQGKTTVVHPKTASSTDSSWVGLAKYAWSGYVLECEVCGIIYRSRQYWYGNRDPVETVVRTEIKHVWPGSNPGLYATQNAARKVLDGVGYISSTVSSMSAGPSKVLSSWMADRIAPPYWKPNAQINHCEFCKLKCDRYHHCRACGDGFCEDCSNYFRPVPERGWGESEVRVCKACKEPCKPDEESGSDEILPRRVGELLQSTIGTVVSAMDYPLGMIKDSVRPSYWVPDEDIIQCNLCQTTFGSKVAKHHCRACGQGVCNGCSPDCRPVPLRGWDQPVRVCKACLQKGEL